MIKRDIFVVGASMGGIEALTKLLAAIPESFPGIIFIVLHVHPNSPSLLDRIFSSKTALKVKFAEDGEIPQAGTVYLAVPDYHLTSAPSATAIFTAIWPSPPRPTTPSLVPLPTFQYFMGE